MTYSGGSPLFLLTASLVLIVAWFTDKVCLLRLYKKPPLYDHTLAKVRLRGKVYWQEPPATCSLAHTKGTIAVHRGHLALCRSTETVLRFVAMVGVNAP